MDNTNPPPTVDQPITPPTPPQQPPVGMPTPPPPPMPTTPPPLPQPMMPSPPQPPPHKSKMLLMIIAAILLLTIGGLSAYIFANSHKQPLVPNDDLIAQVSPTAIVPSPTTNPTAAWLITPVTTCNLSLRVPTGWHTGSNTNAQFGPPEDTTGCITITAPDFNPNTETETEIGLIIKIDKIKLGAKFQGATVNSITVNTVDDFVAATETTQEPKVAAKNVQNKTYGAYTGKYFEYSAFFTYSTFVFQHSNYLYSIYWPTLYNGPYKINIGDIISSITFDK